MFELKLGHLTIVTTGFNRDDAMNRRRGGMTPSSGYCTKLVLSLVILMSACQATKEQLAVLDDDAGALRAPVVSELPGGSAFVSLETRKGITQKFAPIRADTPVANVLLFAGGGGVLGLIKSTSSRPGMSGDLRGNFLIRSKENFISQGLNVVLVDAPSDKQGGMQGGFRTSGYHVKDIEGVINFLSGNALVCRSGWLARVEGPSQPHT